MPRYNRRFRSYTILKSTGLLEFLCWAKWRNMRNLNFWPQIQYNLRKLPIIALWTTFSDFQHILTWLTWLSQTKVITIRKQRGRVGFCRKLETDLKSEWDRNWIRAELPDPLRWGLNSSSNLFSSVLPISYRMCQNLCWSQTVQIWEKRITQKL
jgi:hypothetical protein